MYAVSRVRASPLCSGDGRCGAIQHDEELAVDGIVGPLTWVALVSGMLAG